MTLPETLQTQLRSKLIKIREFDAFDVPQLIHEADRWHIFKQAYCKSIAQRKQLLASP